MGRLRESPHWEHKRDRWHRPFADAHKEYDRSAERANVGQCTDTMMLEAQGEKSLGVIRSVNHFKQLILQVLMLHGAFSEKC